MNQTVARAQASNVTRAIADLTAAFGNRVVTSMAVREQHGYTTTWVTNEPPDAVFFRNRPRMCSRRCASAPSNMCR